MKISILEFLHRYDPNLVKKFELEDGEFLV